MKKLLFLLMSTALLLSLLVLPAYADEDNMFNDGQLVWGDCASEGHKYDAGTVTKAATCTATGVKTYTCKVCKETKTETIAKKAHDYKAATCTAPKTCKACGVTSGNALGHKYDAGKVTKAATCTKTGVKTYTCSVCKGTKTETIAKKAHSYSNATCTKAKTCKVCKATTGKALGHKWNSGKVTKAATCAKTGVKTYTCSVCKGTKTEAIAKIKTHKYTNACDTSCNVCKATRKITHKYATVTKKATATANGYTVKRCSVCKKETGKTTIYKASSIKLAKTAYTYNGKAQKPGVVIKDSKGKTIATSNYTVTYATGRKNVGTYKVTVKFKGKYSGTKVLTFKINPVKTTVSKVTPGTKKLTVAITKKTAQVTGYEVQYATNKSFKSAKTKTLTKTSLSLTGLKAKTTYYIRVRTYKVVSGKKVYSAWSVVKTAKTK